MKYLRKISAIQRLYVRFSSSTSGSFQPKVIETIPAAIHTHLFGSTPPKTACLQEIALQLPQLKGKDIVEHFRTIAKEQGRPYLDWLDQAAGQFNYDFVKDNDGKVSNWVDRLVSNSHTSVKFRPPDKVEWQLQPGWTHYSHEDGSSRQVPYPEEDVLFFDVEVCVQDGLLPTMAVALSYKAWYGWCSNRLVQGGDLPIDGASTEYLIPLGDPRHPRLAIGHNVGYDRVRVKECYDREGHQLRFMDTMSMSVSMFGMADHQTTTFSADSLDETIEDTPDLKYKYKEKRGWEKEWKKRVTKNGLKDVTNFLFGIEMDKETRNYFTKDSIEVIQERFQELMCYCAMDNLATALIYSKMWPMFKSRFPEDITSFGMLQMGNSYLPINRHWREFYNKNNEDNDNSKQQDAVWNLLEVAQAVLKLQEDERFLADDLWMWEHTDKKWFRQLFKKTKTMEFVLENGVKFASADDVVTKSQLVPSLFGLIYNNHPLYLLSGHGWGYLAPMDRNKSAKETLERAVSEKTTIDKPAKETTRKKKPVDKPAKEIIEKFAGINIKALEKQIKEFMDDYGATNLPEKVDVRMEDLNCDFYKIPHPEGTSANVGSVMSKGFYKKFEEGIIRPTRFQSQFDDLFGSSKRTKHWTNYRKRFEEEIDVYYDEEKNIGAIAPAIRPAGTISRRSVHKLWVTLTNDTGEKEIGKGIKTMVQAHDGMRIVGADVDSQEQWLAAVYGDASVAQIYPEEERLPGITPFSNMMLAGSKSDGSDLHSVVARELKISRNEAKTLNYARLYGSGERHAVKMLMRSLSSEAAKQVAANLFALTKGLVLKCRQLSDEVVPIFCEYEDEVGEQVKTVIQGNIYLPAYDTEYGKQVFDFEDWVLKKLLQQNYKVSESTVTLLYKDITKVEKHYFNGYETATFNFLEEEAKKDILRTPVLNCQMTDALSALPPDTPDRDVYAKKFKRSVMNWIVQSSAVDFLHLLLLSMDWLCKEYKIPARFVISIHDEVRYQCKEEDAPRVALALMISHLYVRSFISQRVGFRQLPMSVAFFSQVDCDTILRKETDTPVKNPDGTMVENGVAWNINDLIKITGGSLE